MKEDPYEKFRGTGKDPRSVALSQIKRVIAEYREGSSATASMSKVEEIYRKFTLKIPRKQNRND